MTEQPDLNELIREGYQREAVLVRRCDEAKAEVERKERALAQASEDASRLRERLAAVARWVHADAPKPMILAGIRAALSDRPEP